MIHNAVLGKNWRYVAIVVKGDVDKHYMLYLFVRLRENEVCWQYVV